MGTAPGARLARRIADLRRRFDDAGVSALLVTHLPNIFYLTGFSGTAGALVVTPDTATLVVDSRYTTVARAVLDQAGGPAGLTLVEVDSTYEAACRDVLVSSAAGPVGVEANQITLDRFDWLVAALEPAGVELRRTRGLVEAGRVRKDEHELEILREAGQRISTVMTAALATLEPGRTELEVAADIDHAIRHAGFERPAFDTIVASGPQTALPHARPGARTLESGDLVLLDFGGLADGYCVDLTRVASLGPPDDDARTWHEAVLAAHRAALDVIRPGVTTCEVDDAARAALDERGLGAAFGHGTGHGLGIEVHEAPRVGQRRAALGAEDPEDVPLEAGMVFTVEPGVYLAGRGGVRLEDDLVVTPEGYALLTDVPLDLFRAGRGPGGR